MDGITPLWASLCAIYPLTFLSKPIRSPGKTWKAFRAVLCSSLMIMTSTSSKTVCHQETWVPEVMRVQATALGKTRQLTGKTWGHVRYFKRPTMKSPQGLRCHNESLSCKGVTEIGWKVGQHEHQNKPAPCRSTQAWSVEQGLGQLRPLKRGHFQVAPANLKLY